MRNPMSVFYLFILYIFVKEIYYELISNEIFKTN
jgi:hypothetical protein